MDAADLTTILGDLGDQLSSYVLPIGGFIAVVTGIKLGFKWLGRYGNKA